MNFILTLLVKIIGSEIGKTLIKKGAETLVNSTDNGIDNEVLNIFLDKAVESKRNKLTKDLKDEIIKKIS